MFFFFFFWWGGGGGGGVETVHLCIQILSFLLVIICGLRLKFKGDR